MDSTHSVRMAPEVQAMSVEATSHIINQSQEGGLLNGIPPDPDSEPPASETSCLPEFFVNLLLPEVPPGNLEQKQSGMYIPKRVAALIRYFGDLSWTMVSGWFAFTQYLALQQKSTGPPFGYVWLASLVLLVLYHVIGPLPRALGDVVGVKPGGYYFYMLQQNDCLHPNFARSFKSLVTVLSTGIQIGVFYLGFFTKVIEQGVKVPAAIVAIVRVVFQLGYMRGTASLQGGGKMQSVQQSSSDLLLREALYSDVHVEPSNRRIARQKLAQRMCGVMVAVWIMFGVFLTIVFVVSNSFGTQWRSNE